MCSAQQGNIFIDNKYATPLGLNTFFRALVSYKYAVPLGLEYHIMLVDTQITSALQAVMGNANIRIFLSLAKSFLCIRYETTTRSFLRYSTYSLRHIFRFLAAQHYWLGIRLWLFKAFFY